MPAAHEPQESIEGEKISGHSRDPLRYQRDKLIGGRKCYLYKVEFNVSAMIEKPLIPGTALLYPDELLPLTDQGDTIACDTAVITSTERVKRNSQNLASNVTATHSANKWDFKKQTHAKVITPRQSIVNAIRKRLLANKAGNVLV